MPTKINIDDLPPALRKQLRVRKTTFSKEAVRQHALRVLAAISILTQDQRARVLAHAAKVNSI